MARTTTLAAIALCTIAAFADVASAQTAVAAPATALPAASTPGATPATAAQSGVNAVNPNQVVVAGTVPDEATRSAILARARELYGAERVVDQLGVGAVVAPPNWSGYVQKLMSPTLKQVSKGQLVISGNNVDFNGEVASQTVSQQIAAEAAASLNPTYVVRNGLRVAAQEQTVLDATLANRIIEFEPSSSVIRPSGLSILDEMVVTMRKLGDKKFEIIGHTDSQGARDANIALSRARAETVVNYMTSKGISANLMTASGVGPDRPTASNATAEGRARNRRIEFRMSQ